MFGLTKSAISALPILSSVAVFWETEQFGNGKLPISRFRLCRFLSLCEILNRGQNRGQIALDSILFDWKTALWYNCLIFYVLFIASQPFACFNLSQLFPFWKQLNQNQTAVQYVQKMHTLISKMETTEIEHE